MLDLPDNLKVSEENMEVLQGIWNQVKEKTETNPFFPHFTDHSITHSKRILRHISDLMDKITLTENEKFVLLSAIALHDIGMYKNSKRIIGEKATPEELDEIRENHHVYSKEWIQNKSHLESPIFNRLRDFIAEVAMNHRKTNIYAYHDQNLDGQEFRISLISALLRLGDCMDISDHRVKLEHLENVDIGNKSQMFWYLCHYVQSIKMKNGKVLIDFKFPQRYESDKIIVETICGHIIKNIRRELEILYDVLYEHGIKMHKDLIISDINYGQAPRLMDERIYNYVLVNLRKLEGEKDMVKPLKSYKPEIVKRLDQYSYDKNVFLMMKDSDGNKGIYDFIKNELESEGFNCILQNDPAWNMMPDNFHYNPIAVLYCCKYGIAVFDEPEEQQLYNANVVYELAVMESNKKEVLILKHSSLPEIPFDIIKNAYKSYTRDIEIRGILKDWIKGITEFK